MSLGSRISLNRSYNLYIQASWMSCTRSRRRRKKKRIASRRQQPRLGGMELLGRRRNLPLVSSFELVFLPFSGACDDDEPADRVQGSPSIHSPLHTDRDWIVMNKRFSVKNKLCVFIYIHQFTRSLWLSQNDRHSSLLIIAVSFSSYSYLIHFLLEFVYIDIVLFPSSFFYTLLQLC